MQPRKRQSLRTTYVMIAAGLGWVLIFPHRPAASQAFVPHPAGPLITTIERRHETISVNAGASGPTYTVQNRTGEVVIKDMTMPELASTNPELSKSIKRLDSATAYAGLDE